MRSIEYGTLPDRYLDISALESGTLEDQTVLHLRMHIYQSHLQLAAGAFTLRWQHVFVAHPLEGAIEGLCYPKNLQIIRELLLDLVALYWVSFVL